MHSKVVIFKLHRFSKGSWISFIEGDICTVTGHAVKDPGCLDNLYEEDAPVRDNAISRSKYFEQTLHIFFVVDSRPPCDDHWIIYHLTETGKCIVLISHGSIGVRIYWKSFLSDLQRHLSSQLMQNSKNCQRQNKGKIFRLWSFIPT